jgi:ribosomal RNA-processing protein 8
LFFFFCFFLKILDLYTDFIREANRVLKVNGHLFITEVTSRIEDVNKFCVAIRNLGFSLVDKNNSNTHFIRFEFTKNGKKPKAKSSGVVLGVCKYKKR